MQPNEYIKQSDIDYINEYSFQRLFDYQVELPSIDEIFESRQIAEWDNPIILLTIIVVGHPGSGKEHFWRHLYNETVLKYKNVALNIEETDPYQYYEKVSNEKIQFNVIPDMTNMLDLFPKKDIPKLIQLHVKRRHTMLEHIEGKQGLRIDVFCLHRLHGVPPIWSTSFDWLDLRSYPTNPHDQGILKGIFGNRGMNVLKKLRPLKKKDPSFKGYSLIATENNNSLAYNPLILK